MRIASIDTLRTIAIFMVICIHSHPFRNLNGQIDLWFNQLNRFAVPFFFIAASYFFTKKLNAGAKVTDLYIRYLTRLTLIFIIWTTIYFFLPLPNKIRTYGIFNGLNQLITERIAWITDHPITFLSQGLTVHLWFITSLIVSLTILYGVIMLNQPGKIGFLNLRDLGNLIFLIAIPLYLFGLLAGAYSKTPLGITFDFNTRDGPFFSTLFIAIGWWLAQRNFKPTLQLAGATIIGGFLLQMTEYLLLSNTYGSMSNPAQGNYLLGTVFFGTGVMLLALAIPQLGKNTPLPNWGKYTLGIYVAHLLVLNYAGKLTHPLPGTISQLVTPVIVYFITLAIVAILAKIKYIRPIVV
jgi:surface polysaccharide O-acyltransferase-like enzyme